MIYLPVETSGEGEINAHSRVQMALGEAKNKAKKEFARSAGEDRSHARSMPRLGGAASRDEEAALSSASHQGLHRTGSHFVLHIAERMKTEGGVPKVEQELAAVAN
ncbi:MAG: hypothetical protein WDO73_17240 [Ignavibacteriota bacterium]